MKNILLTGANGFIGNYFTEKYKKNYNIETFSFLNDNFKELNLSSTGTVVHLSALVHQMGGASEEEYERVNVAQTLELARKAKESGVKQFIFMSTIAVYGIETGVINEESDCNPISDYGKSKYKAELELQKLEDDNFKVSIVRPPIVNGYNAPGNMKSLISLVSRVFILPFGNIQNRRSMVYVGNLCYLIDVLVRFPIRSGMTNNIFLASDDEPLSTTRLIELITENLNKKVYLLKIPFFQSFLKLVKPSFHKRLYESLEVDNSITKKVLGFENLYSVKDGIQFMIRGEDR